MDCIKFTLPCKAFSINQAFYATRKVKTRECRDWEEMILHHLKRLVTEPPEKFKGEVDVYLDFIYPTNVFWTKEMVISSKTFDLSNVEKLLIDVIFGQWLNINDKNIRKLVSVKNPGQAWAIDVTLEFHAYDKS